MIRLENRIPPPVLVFLVGAAMAAASRSLSALSIPWALRLGVGLAILAGGFVLVARGFRTLRAAGTTIDPVNIDRASALVTHGILGRTRNPMYLGFATMLVGWAAVLAVPWVVVGPAFFVAFTTRFQIIPEERAMRVRFGEEYASYVRRVPRWLA